MNIQEFTDTVKANANGWVAKVEDSNYTKNIDGFSLEDVISNGTEFTSIKLVETACYGYIRFYKVNIYRNNRDYKANTPKSTFVLKISFYNGIRATNTVESITVEV